MYSITVNRWRSKIFFRNFGVRWDLVGRLLLWLSNLCWIQKFWPITITCWIAGRCMHALYFCSHLQRSMPVATDMATRQLPGVDGVIRLWAVNDSAGLRPVPTGTVQRVRRWLYLSQFTQYRVEKDRQKNVFTCRAKAGLGLNKSPV